MAGELNDLAANESLSPAIESPYRKLANAKCSQCGESLVSGR